MAVAVYVVVVLGVTACAPPLPGNVNVVGSTLSVITTCVALLAVTVSIAEVPVVTEFGLAVILTVGAEVAGGGVAFTMPVQEVSVATPANEMQLSVAAQRRREARRDRDLASFRRAWCRGQLDRLPKLSTTSHSAAQDPASFV